MTFPTALNAMLQVIAALLIFVAGCLGLVLFTIICLVIAELISDRANVVRVYEVSSDSLDDGVSSEVQGTIRESTGPRSTIQTEAASHGFASYRHFHPSVSKLPDRRHIEFKAS
jgi:hypothetical protein